MLDRYVDQVRLLLGVLPDIASEEVFALKGGSAINLFCRDMPRLSVDIDLTYLPVGDRKTSLKDIDETLDRIMSAIAKRNPRILARRIAGGGNNDTRIMVSDGQARIKIETSPVTRGTVHPPTRRMASDAVVDQFGFAEMNVLAFEDLYGGKLHAALDRQHPRDLFDIKLLYDNEGLTDDLFRVFMVYVASSGRPMHELLAPTAPLDEALYDDEFVGMTREMVTKEELADTRERLHADIRRRLKGDTAEFLLSLHDAEPDFDLIGLPDSSSLPAVQWKLMNLEKLKRDNPEKHAAQREELKNLFQ
ncbi:nucleotidyl transferase AbiEii/AbiGii toxin family protein [Microbaculum marinum]|uniref:Nucleotidyl transferase AbiEii/AbiGii toxin family protein n=1 Tax=Microbaculum marinum TaxID=1764581 RepID=A0AAW9RN60_9HYPH